MLKHSTNNQSLPLPWWPQTLRDTSGCYPSCQYRSITVSDRLFLTGRDAIKYFSQSHNTATQHVTINILHKEMEACLVQGWTARAAMPEHHGSIPVRTKSYPFCEGSIRRATVKETLGFLCVLFQSVCVEHLALRTAIHAAAFPVSW